MVWETVSKASVDAVKMNHWPRPTNWVEDISVLVCNQDTFVMQIKLAYALAARFFWTNLLPSPREVERKFFTGGYRCGFYLNVKVKSPVEVLWGAGTSRMVAEIARPFATGLFWWWATETAMDALNSWGTLIYPQYQCVDDVGDGMRKMDFAFLTNGPTAGGVGLGQKVFDKYGIIANNTANVLFPPGYWRVQACWAVPNDPVNIDWVKVGLRIDGGAIDIDDVPLSGTSPIAWGQKQMEGHSPTGLSVSAHFESHRPSGLPVIAITCTYFIVSWSPTPFPPGHDLLPGAREPFPERQYPDCPELLAILTE